MTDSAYDWLENQAKHRQGMDGLPDCIFGLFSTMDDTEVVPP